MRSTRFLRLHLAVALTLSVCWVWAQQAPPKPATPQQQQAATPSSGPSTFSATSQLVVEDITVTDKNGKPIEGLTAKDFTITEDNVAQEIKFCEYQKMIDTAPPVATTPAVPAPSADDKPKVPGVTMIEIAPEKPGDVRYKDRRLVALYFDMGAMPVPDQLRSQGAALKFLRSEMQPADLVAVFAFSDRLHVLTDFTDDRLKVAETIEKLFIGEDQGFDQATNDDATADVGSAFGEDDAEFNIFTTDRQLAALQTAVKMLGGLNEKKVLVYFASGLRLNGVDNQAQLQATTNAAIKANVAFYTVDARGLVAQAPLGDATHGSPGGVGMYSGASALAMTSNFQRSQDTLYALAKDTGGKAFLDNNDLSKGVVQAEQSISSYYILGYYSKNEALDGKFRRIKITLNGHPDAKIDYRQGYWAGKVFSKFTTVDKERQLMDALMLGDPITELTIQMEVNYFQLNGAEYYVPVTMKIPGSELALARRRGAEHTVIDFIGEVKDEYNVTIANVRDKVDMKLSGETAERLAHQPIQYGTAFTVLPGKYSIKVLARDDETGRIGTYLAKFEVPNLDREAKRVAISSVVLSGQRNPVKEAVYTAAQKDKLPPVDPLIQDGQQLMPSVTRVFSKRRDMYVYLQAYERKYEKVEPIVAFVTFYRGQSKAFETAPIQFSEGMDNKLHTVPLRFSLSLAKLNPGKYDCQVSVIDPTGQKASFWAAPVMVVP
jgi:VWFA-related protein